jgi:acyl-CoA synthetase (NDP forming)
LKGLRAAILHKSDAGAVYLNLETEADVRAAYRDLACRLESRLEAVFVQRMAPDGVEMFIGGLQDALFGPVIFCGSGGVLVELCADAVCRLCPLTREEAADMLAEVRGAARLRGHRGRPVADEAAFRDALLRVAALLHVCPEIQEMDINPVNVRTSGVAALDARIRVAPPASASTSRRVTY